VIGDWGSGTGDWGLGIGSSHWFFKSNDYLSRVIIRLKR
jgi:hypothetical protein